MSLSDSLDHSHSPPRRVPHAINTRRRELEVYEITEEEKSPYRTHKALPPRGVRGLKGGGGAGGMQHSQMKQHGAYFEEDDALASSLIAGTWSDSKRYDPHEYEVTHGREEEGFGITDEGFELHPRSREGEGEGESGYGSGGDGKRRGGRRSDERVSEGGGEREGGDDVLIWDSIVDSHAGGGERRRNKRRGMQHQHRYGGGSEEYREERLEVVKRSPGRRKGAGQGWAEDRMSDVLEEELLEGGGSESGEDRERGSTRRRAGRSLSVDTSDDPVYQRLLALKDDHLDNLRRIERLYAEQTGGKTLADTFRHHQHEKKQDVTASLPPRPQSTRRSRMSTATFESGRPMSAGRNRVTRSLSASWDSRPKFTIPEPFSFTMRDSAAKKKTVSQQKIEQELREKAAREEEEQKIRFKARDMPDFKKLHDKAEAEKLERVVAVMEEKPFSFYSRDKEKFEQKMLRSQSADDLYHIDRSFRAKRVPEHVRKNLYVPPELEKASRDARISRRAAETLRSASLPRRMQLHADEAEAMKGMTKTKERREGTFKPNIRESTRQYEGLLRNLEHQKKEKEIKENRGFVPRTEILAENRKENERLRRERGEVSELDQPVRDQRWPFGIVTKATPNPILEKEKSARSHDDASSTVSNERSLGVLGKSEKLKQREYEARERVRRLKEREKEKEEERRKREKEEEDRAKREAARERARRKRLDSLRTAVRDNVQSMVKSRMAKLKEETEATMKSNKEGMAARDREYQDELDNTYQKLRRRKTLIELQEEFAAKKEMEKKLREAALNERGGGGRKNVNMRLLNEAKRKAVNSKLKDKEGKARQEMANAMIREQYPG
mmetsp:Transcript_16378/g.41546  ORF Transcript_16378/g.41546 Transcript_16378/m.41546 type:complete len:841 (-) Transcript_16378:737-3259(-)